MLARHDSWQAGPPPAGRQSRLRTEDALMVDQGRAARIDGESVA
ncbi:MAG: hypothetical protein PVG99_15665 [Desulfobacteraceae bacterium]|jgi:hypothetical protein